MLNVLLKWRCFKCLHQAVGIYPLLFGDYQSKLSQCCWTKYAFILCLDCLELFVSFSIYKVEIIFSDDVASALHLESCCHSAAAAWQGKLVVLQLLWRQDSCTGVPDSLVHWWKVTNCCESMKGYRAVWTVRKWLEDFGKNKEIINMYSKVADKGNCRDRAKGTGVCVLSVRCVHNPKLQWVKEGLFVKWF